MEAILEMSSGAIFSNSLPWWEALHQKAGSLPSTVCNPSEKIDFGTLANRRRCEQRIWCELGFLFLQKTLSIFGNLE